MGSTSHRPTGGVPGSGGGTSTARVRTRALGLERRAGEKCLIGGFKFQMGYGLKKGFCVGI